MTSPSRRRGEGGQAAGVESIPFGVLVFVGGLLLLVNAWVFVDRRASVDAAASAYLRSYTAASTAAEGRTQGDVAARASLGDQLDTASMLEIRHPSELFGPCRVAEVTISVEVPTIDMPFIGSFGQTTVRTTQRELVQPFGAARNEFAGPPLAGTVCDG